MFTNPEEFVDSDRAGGQRGMNARAIDEDVGTNYASMRCFNFLLTLPVGQWRHDFIAFANIYSMLSQPGARIEARGFRKCVQKPVARVINDENGI